MPLRIVQGASRALVLGLIVGGFLVPAQVAGAQAMTFTGSSTFPDFTLDNPSPCTPEPIVVSGTVHFVGHQTVTVGPDGSIRTHEVDEMNMDLTGVGASGTRYTLVMVTASAGNTFGVNGEPQPLADASTVTSRLRVISSGSTPDFFLDLVLHVTITPTGRQVAVSDSSVTCR